MLRLMHAAETGLQLAVQRTDAGRTVDLDLVADRQMQPHVQERVLFA